ncbi:hypothetical protein [Paraburkholderia sp.]|uniref:hypothetical protein n=1 Tax=Paraburkholderia sp. TaxID=1926495 RepID=UPI0025DAA958|nr:hypothetical protein [Paraburkholderia sp.]
MILSDEDLKAVIAAEQLAERREKKRERLGKARSMLPQLVAQVKEAEANLRRDFEQRHEVEVGRDNKTGAYYIVSFEGSWKVPEELVKLLLLDESLWNIPRRQQHERMVPRVLKALNADAAETVPEKVWGRPLKEYQLEPIRKRLIAQGYHPTEQHKTVAHFLRLLKAGKAQQPASEAATSAGEGENRVTFSSKKAMYFRGRSYSLQWRGNSARVKHDGELVGVLTLLAGTGNDMRTIIDISDNAEAQYQAKEAARLQAEREEAEIGALFEEVPEPPSSRAKNAGKLRAATVGEDEE